MTSPVPRDQRRSFRCPAFDPRREAELRAGDKRLSARVLDESAGGFAVVVAGKPGLNVGEVAQLRTEAGWFEVRVSNVTVTAVGPIGPPAADEPQPAGADGQASDRTVAHRLGLCRLRERDPPEEERRGRRPGWWRSCLAWTFAQVLPAHHSMLAVGAVVAVLAVGVPLLTVGLLSYGDDPSVQRMTQWSDGVLSAVVGKSGPHEPADAATSETGRAAGTGESGVSPQDALRRTARRLPGVAPFTLPEAARFLGLTAPQQEQIRQIDEDATRRLQSLDRQWRGSRHELTERRTSLLDDARRQALEALTGEQRTRWQELASP
jgi:hypothetical protein